MKVSIDPKDNNKIQRLFFEHAAGRDNIAFLMKDKDVQWDILQHYINVVEKRFAELELLKQELTKKYEPLELKDKDYDYLFDFDNEQIVYTLKNAVK